MSEHANQFVLGYGSQLPAALKDLSDWWKIPRNSFTDQLPLIVPLICVLQFMLSVGWKRNVKDEKPDLKVKDKSLLLRQRALIALRVAFCLSLFALKVSTFGNPHWQMSLALMSLGVLSCTSNILLVLFASVLLAAFDPYVLCVSLATSLIPQSVYADDAEVEQASLFSILTYSHLDAFVYRIWRNPTASDLKMPKLSASNKIQKLCDEAIPYLELKSDKRPFDHILPNLIWLNIWPLCAMTIVLIIATLCNFLPVLVLQSFLNSIAGNRENTLLLAFLFFVVPMMRSLFLHRYHELSAGIVWRNKNILTVLLVKHSLKMHSIPPGKFLTLVSVDCRNLLDWTGALFNLIVIPMDVIGSTTILYLIVGKSALIGLGASLCFVYFPKYMAAKMKRQQSKLMRATEARLQLIGENVQNLLTTKLFAWEVAVMARINLRRKTEMEQIIKLTMINIMTFLVFELVPIISLTVLFSSYTLLEENNLTASQIFSSIRLVKSFSEQLRHVTKFAQYYQRASISTERINEFLQGNNMLQDMPEKRNMTGFHNADFSWGDESEAESRKFKLALDDVVFHENAINLIVGPTGAGKSSVLLALLGEMKFFPRGNDGDSYFYLPRDGGVSYCAQDPCLVNATIESNILFGQPMDRMRYETVVKECALLPDFDMFESEDQTEIGERGITLSGGQKARVSLARALYSNAKMVLLDDIFSALDVHTSKHIMSQAFGGSLVRDRTVILVTHHLSLIGSKSSLVVQIEDGRCIRSGSFADVLSRDPGLAVVDEMDLKEDLDVRYDTAKTSKNMLGSCILIVPERRETGKVKRSYQLNYLEEFGGGLYWGGLFLALVASEALLIVSVWWLGVWSNAGEGTNVNITLHYLAIYLAIFLVAESIKSSWSLIFTFGKLRASTAIHSQLVKSIFNTTMRWLNVTPIGRITSRFSEDISLIDNDLADDLSDLLLNSFSMALRVVAMCYSNSILILPSIVVSMGGVFLGSIYKSAKTPVQRQVSITRAPIHSSFAMVINSLHTLRAYNMQDDVQKDFVRKCEQNLQAVITQRRLNRWLGVRSDMLTSALPASVAAAFVLFSGPIINVGMVGFALYQATAFSQQTILLVRALNDFDVSCNALERCYGYIDDVPHETSPDDKRVKPAAAWPCSGSLTVANLSARYGAEGESPDVLRGISFDVKSGEKIGLVGRTGSGKSSLCLALLQAIPTSGTVLYDGVDTKTVELQSLRKQITIIPQEPKLYAGSLRKNLDPWEENDDMLLNSALRSVGLFGQKIRVAANAAGKATDSDAADVTVNATDNKDTDASTANATPAHVTKNTETLGEGAAEGAATPASTTSTATSESIPITLDTLLTTGGANLSQGQRQLIALARAIVRKSKLIISDEATSSLDHETDLSIQKALRVDLHGVTMLTIAHRLRTIMDYDRVMVLADGEIVEFDTPAALIAKRDSKFLAMVEASGEAELLKRIAVHGNQDGRYP